MLWYWCQICLTNFKKQTAFFFAVACPFTQNYSPVVFKRQCRFKWHFEYFSATKGSINTESDLHLKPTINSVSHKMFLFYAKKLKWMLTTKTGKNKKGDQPFNKTKIKGDTSSAYVWFLTYLSSHDWHRSVSRIVLLIFYFGISLGPLANIFGWFFTSQVLKYKEGLKMKNKQR